MGRHRRRSEKKRTSQNRREKGGGRSFHRRGFQRSSETYIGKVQKNPRGFAFIIPTKHGQPDAYVSPEDSRVLLEGDKVEYTLIRRGERSAGKILRILERSQTKIVGKLRVEKKNTFLETVTEDLFLLNEKVSPEFRNQWAFTRIVHYPQERRPGVVELVEVLGPKLLPKHDYIVSSSRFGLPDAFSHATLDEAERFVSISRKEIEGLRTRKDLRSQPFVTIDGEDAKDFDDAILVEREGSGFCLYVAIADVSFFVRPNSPLDQEARKRGTSVYFPGFCLPMLPERLSNDLCSLRPQEDKLSLVAEIHFDRIGNATRTQFYEAVIKTAARLTYTKVQGFFNSEKPFVDELEFLRTPLTQAKHLYELLLQRRKDRGVLDFELPECKIEIDQDGNPNRVKKVERLDSHKLIEEFMIAANSEVARALREDDVGSLFRVHEPPSPDTLDELNQLMKNLGISRVVEDLSPKSFARILEATVQLKGAATLHQSILRMQKQARYEPDPKGHFGLALQDYTHFTSPIRRYPDLVVHRSLKKLILSDRNTEEKVGDSVSLEQLGLETSERERRAVEAERFAVKRKQCWFLKPRVGETFEGRIGSFTTRGMFIELPEYAIEGYLPYDTLKVRVAYDERKNLLRRLDLPPLHLGDPMRVLLARVSVEDLEIEFIEG